MGKNYRVDGNLDHNQVVYKTGDIINLEDEFAEPLLAIGRIKPVEDAAQENAPEQPNNNNQGQDNPNPAPANPTAPENSPTEPTPPADPNANPQNVGAENAPEQPQNGQPTPEEIANTAAQVQ